MPPQNRTKLEFCMLMNEEDAPDATSDNTKISFAFEICEQNETLNKIFPTQLDMPKHITEMQYKFKYDVEQKLQKTRKSCRLMII